MRLTLVSLPLRGDRRISILLQLGLYLRAGIAIAKGADGNAIKAVVSVTVDERREFLLLQVLHQRSGVGFHLHRADLQNKSGIHRRSCAGQNDRA